MAVEIYQATSLKSLVFWLEYTSKLDELVQLRKYWDRRDYVGFMDLNKGVCPMCKGNVYFDPKDAQGEPKVINGIVTDRVACYCLTLKMLSFKPSRWYESHYMDSYLDELKAYRLSQFEGTGADQKIITNLGKFLKNPTRSALIHGNTGTGKTHMLQSVKTHFGGMAVYIAFNDLFDKIMGYVKCDKDKIGELTDYLRLAPILLLDDYGLQHQTEWTLNVVASIINARYNMRRYAPTIMTTNRNWNEIQAAVGTENGIANEHRILSRMIDSEYAAVMTVLQDGYRKKVKLKEAGYLKKAGVK